MACMITKKLYLENMYATHARAKVIKIQDKEIYLDQTIFYPEGGGQVGDIGLVGSVRVVDTQKRVTDKTKTLYHPDFPVINVNSEIAHIMDGDLQLIHVGDEVDLSIDWERRKKIMMMHSAAHVVYYFTFKVMGSMPVKGCYIQPDKARFDFAAKIDSTKLPLVEQLTNDFIKRSLDIFNVPLENEIEALYWICDEIKLPCGGTHVKNTREIGSVKLKRSSQGKNIDRIYITCS
jgi:alanyl-tRNA synthetase